MPSRRLRPPRPRLLNVGVDLGGSRLRVAFARPGRPVERRIDVPAVPPHRLPELLHRLFRGAGIDRAERLIVGSKGVWTLPERTSMSRACARLARRVTVLSDAELGGWAARASDAHPGAGVHVVVGTGSMALGFLPSGRLLREGGEGPAVGDVGSGYWLGRRGMEMAGRRPPRPTPAGIAATAAWARRVVRSSDPRRRALQREAQRGLAAMIARLVRRLPANRPWDLSGGGALYAHSGFRRGLQRALRRILGRKIRYRRPVRDAAGAAARRADYFAGRTPPAVPPRRGARK